MIFSIITATYNAAATLRHCLASVQAQKGTGQGTGSKSTCPRSAVEHLLIDGGSTDKTLEIVKSVTGDSLIVTGNGSRETVTDDGKCALEKNRVTNHESRITRLVSEPDNGLYDAMNKGLRMATGEIIGILNADDFYADERVQERVATAFDNPEVDACYGDLVYVREAGTGLEARLSRGRTRPTDRFNTGGSPECLDADCGLVVERGDLLGLVAAIASVREVGKAAYSGFCQKRARESFDKDARFGEYVGLYSAYFQ